MEQLGRLTQVERLLRGRSDELAIAAELLRTRSSIDIVGAHLSGRTSFLKELGRRLDSVGLDYLFISGIEDFQDHPFGTLMASGLFAPNDANVTVSRAIEALSNQLGDGRAVILVDNWNDLDDLSRGVIQSVSAQRNVPVASTRLSVPAPRSRAAEKHSAAARSRLLIEMKPVSSDDLALILRDYLGGAVDASLGARIFSKSGGNIGLAIKLADSAVTHKRILSEGTAWRVKHDLWNPALLGVIEDFLTGLTPTAQDALEVLALSGVRELPAATKLVGWDMLEELESHSFLKMYSAQDQNLLTLSPPLIVEYFRRSPATLRRLRQEQLIEHKLGCAIPHASAEHQAADALESDAEQDAMFTRIIREQAKSRALEAAERWQHDPTADSCVAYVKALAKTDASMLDIESALYATPATGSLAAQAELVRLRAEWRACTLNDLDGALADLEASRDQLGEYERCVDAYAVTLESMLRSVPEDFEARLTPSPGLVAPVEDKLGRTLALVLSITGRFDEAKDAYDRTVQAITTGNDPLLNYILFGQGHVQQAHARSAEGFEHALAELDLEGCHAHAVVLSGILIPDGRFTELKRILATILSAGGSARFLAEWSTQQSLEVSAAVLALHQGRPKTALAHLEAADEFGLEGPFQAQSSQWAAAQLMIQQGEQASAAELLWEESIHLWRRNAKPAAVYGMLRSIEISPSPQRLALTQTKLKTIQSPSLSAYFDYLLLVQENRYNNTAEVAAKLLDTMQTALALSSYRAAADHFRKAGDTERTEAMNEALAKLKKQHSEVSDAGMGQAPHPSLTPRELQVAWLVAFGRSNQEIAEELTLSVRTVETHVHKIMKKTNAKTRLQVADRL
ncbi:hypothetical protein G7068_06615 [Leucobacter viscericola]|uniref:HTH luxR-type domain-containing protein n=1 Tax=Leucobacter viscericola TaxID=2714935 RepID=A0A6G7XET2_9MICO|nr:LuxR C-terminal-related transcriptional regulator [Leucobacter viscericola]QIK62907.1 hypothetical protein G7068_06615 [Leucobacter viscericola]